ncbi:MAG: hypothetical protein HRT35_02445 [Algicola sp.]|nr:hypothetical protein [Algicola sp.]
MQAPKAALVLSIVFLLFGAVDLLSRVLFSVDVATQNTQTDKAQLDEQKTGAMLLSIKAVEKLLDWSDVKPKVVKKAVTTTVAAQPGVVAKPKVDVHAVVKAAIAGDVSKTLIGDDLLSLKGVFYDGHQFAVVEVENIITKKIQYYRAKANESLASHLLVKIGKNHVLIKSGEQNIKLQMFDNF